MSDSKSRSIRNLFSNTSSNPPEDPYDDAMILVSGPDLEVVLTSVLPNDENQPLNAPIYAGQVLTGNSKRTILIYNLVSTAFSLGTPSDLTQIPEGQIFLGAFSRLSNTATCVLERDDMRDIMVTAKMVVPRVFRIARFLGLWKELYIIKGPESLLWEYS